MTHLYIATPMYGGMCTGFYTQSIIQLQKLCNDRGIHITFSFMFNESLITRARNALVKGFLDTDATHLMFIDADIRFSPEHVLQMIEADQDILCGIYPKKEINWQTVENAIKAGVPRENLKNHTGSFVVNLVDYSGSVTVPLNQPVEIWNGGTGFMLVKRQVFETMKDKVPTYLNNVVDLEQTIRPEDVIHEFFATSIEPETNVLLSEDYHFCRICRLNGIRVYAAPWAALSHVGTYVFEGQLVSAP